MSASATPVTLAARVGAVILVGLVVLLALSFRASGKGWFHKGYTLWAEFETVSGIEVGSEVVLAGVRIGQVEAMELAETSAGAVEDGQVRLQLLIDEPHRIAQDAVGTIRLKTLLGNYQLYVTHGTPQAGVLAPDATLRTAPSTDITQALASLGEFAGAAGEAEGLMRSLNSNQQQLFAKLNAVIDENREPLRGAIASISTAAPAIADAAPRVALAADELTTFIARVNAGEGTLGRLAADAALYDDVRQASGALASAAGDLQAGRGTLGRLLQDEQLGEEAASAITNMNAAAGEARAVIAANGPRLTAALDTITSAGTALGPALGDLGQAAAKLNGREGTLGLLLNDPELYLQATEALAQIRRTFEEGEEQSVMRAFLGVFFGSVI